ncbi:cytochrome C oxidase subunit II [bacterium]|nr:cytochrome C oxidase subunit II [bacterium]
MLKEKMAKGPNFIHPEKPSAVGSRNSINRDGRDEYQEAAVVVDEEIDKILNHVKSKLPPEILDKLDVMGGIKDKIQNYYNQNLQNMQNRYMVTVEDELLKKYRDLIDQEEYNQLNRYTARSISDILNKIGGQDQFNTAEIEKSIANVFGHLQGHIQRGVHEIEQNTNSLLRQKNDVGSFIRKENAYAIVKCSFKNNSLKPKTVFDVKLAINILDSELITPIYHCQKPVQHLLKETISDHIQQKIEQKIDEANFLRVDRGQDELGGDEKFLKKIQALEEFLSFDSEKDDENSKRYDFVAKRFMDSLESKDFEMTPQNEEMQRIRDSVNLVIETENIANKGFNRVVNALTSILDVSKMGYQFIENYKNARVCIIREYEVKNKIEIPDEAFTIRLSYFDHDQLVNLREAYDRQISDVSEEIRKLVDIVEQIFQDWCEENGVQNYETVSREILAEGKNNQKKWWEFWKAEEKIVDEEDMLWNELTFMEADANKADTTTKRFDAKILKAQLKVVKQKVLKVYTNQYPRERAIIEERIKFLENSYQELFSTINPHHIQQGLVLEVDITSVKQKRTTMSAMSNVLNEFLFQVSKGFLDQAMETYAGNRPRSIISDDIDRKFTSVLQTMDRSLEDVEA